MSATPANWYPDPTRRSELRYWDGAAWTHHVSTGGVVGTDPVDAGPIDAGPDRPGRLDRLDGALTVGDEADRERIRQQVSGGAGLRSANVESPAFHGGGSLFTEPVLVVNQKAKIIELNNQYGVFDKDGNRLASVNQVGQSAAKKALRLLSSIDQFLTHKLEVTDAAGAVVLRITRPGKVLKSTVIVADAAGTELGRIVQQNVIGKIHFALVAGDQVIGAIRAENWRAWNFRIEDAAGTEVARITKTFEGIARTIFTTADNYVVQIHNALPQPLNALVVASALSVDTALKQDNRGLG